MRVCVVRRVDIPSRPPPILRYSRWFAESRNTYFSRGLEHIRASHCLPTDVTLRVDKTSASGYIEERELYHFCSIFSLAIRSPVSLDSTPRVFPSKKSRSISRCVLERTRARERGRKRNFRNCRNAINSVAGYRGYRGLRRKFRPNNQPCRSFSSTSPHLSLSLSPFSPSPFTFLR